MPQDKHQFHMSCDFKVLPVPKVVYSLARNILDDKNVSTESRTLAALVIELAQTIDNICSAVETGTMTVLLPDPVAKRLAEMRRNGELNNDELL